MASRQGGGRGLVRHRRREVSCAAGCGARGNACCRRLKKALSKRDYRAACKALADLREPIDRFFDDVLVMDDDTVVRENRLKLLNLFAAVFDDVANIGALSKKG